VEPEEKTPDLPAPLVEMPPWIVESVFQYKYHVVMVDLRFLKHFHVSRGNSPGDYTNCHPSSHPVSIQKVSKI